MSNRSSYPASAPASEAVVGVGVGVLLTLVTCGIYGLFWQYKQIQVLNAWLGREDFNFGLWIVLSIVTCGIFLVYYEYRLSQGVNEIQGRKELPVDQDLGLICVLLSVFGLHIGSLALRQNAINGFYGSSYDF